MTEVNLVAECDAPVDVAFAYLADYRNVLDYWHGMTAFEPVGDLVHGMGSMFRSEVKIGPTVLKSTVRTVVWEENARLCYQSVAGMDSATSFTLTPLGEHRTRIAFHVDFRLPGGIAGKAMEKSILPLVNTAGRKTVENLANCIATQYAARG